MRGFLRTFALSAFVAAVTMGGAAEVFAGAVASGPRPENIRFRWPGSVVKVGISSSFFQSPNNLRVGSDVIGAFTRSFTAWENAAGIKIDWQIVDKQSVSPTGPVGDGMSVITVAGTSENVLFFSRPGSTNNTEAARTRVFYNRKGHITEADIALSPFEQFSTDGSFGTFDLETVLTHEIGHMLGLGHTFAAGSAMSDRQQKNGSLGLQMTTIRGVPDADAAAVRDLYGYSADGGDCCVVFTGKIVEDDDRPSAAAHIWAEDTSTGQLAGYSSVGANGTFRIGGLPKGDYELFARPAEGSGPAIRMLSVNAAEGNITLDPFRISGSKDPLTVELVGLAGQLTDSPIILRTGEEYTLLLGGRGLSDDIVVSFSSTLIRSAGKPRVRDNISDRLSAISVDVTLDDLIVPGVYTVYVTREDSDAAFVGALIVRKPI